MRRRFRILLGFLVMMTAAPFAYPAKSQTAMPTEDSITSPFSPFAPMRAATRQIEAEAQALRAARMPKAEQAPQTGMDMVNQIARDTQIPPNVLLAIIEASGADTPERAFEVARNAGNRLSRLVGEGKTIRQALNEATGDKAVADSLARRAIQIADEIDPIARPGAEKVNTSPSTGTLTAAVVSGVVGGVAYLMFFLIAWTRNAFKKRSVNSERPLSKNKAV